MNVVRAPEQHVREADVSATDDRTEPTVLGRSAASPRPASARARVVAASVVACLLASPVAAGSWAQERSSGDIASELDSSRGETSTLRAELDDVRADITVAQEELAAIGARLADARGRLHAAEGQVLLGEAALEDALRAQARAEAAHTRAEARLAATEERLVTEEAILTDQIVQTFKYGTVGATSGAMALEILRRAQDPNEFAVAMKQLQTVVDSQDATVQSVFELRQARSSQADEAARARGRAVQSAADAADTLRVLEELRAGAATLAEEVAADERAQEALLTSLQISEEETAALLQRAAGRQATLEREYQQQRAREEAAARAAAPTGGGAGGGPALAGMVCPVVGAVAGRDFSNDWGYPRSGGRSHQGNDIFAAKGAPVVAVHDGVVVRWNPPSAPTALGGITVTYRTADGSEWYNAHLDSVAPGISPGVAVARGQQIGTVGNSGNARTTPPHLHLGRRVGGWVNPWPSVAPVC